MIGLVRVDWAGGPGGSGLTTIAVNAGADGSALTAAVGGAVCGAVDAWVQTWDAIIPSAYTRKVRREIDVFDTATGKLAWTVPSTGTSSTRTGTATGAYAAGVGCRVVWLTGQVRNGRRVKGSSFIVPLSTGSYEADGTISQTTFNFLTNSSAGMISGLSSAGAPMMVWHRPRSGVADGAAFQVSGYSLPDKVSWLRSRRS